jgi:hypothetical protein
MAREYGGLGGLSERRAVASDDAFEMAVVRALGDDMAADDGLCTEVWSALANVDWAHEGGDTASYSFRAAGDLVAAVSGKGNYMDWYCSGPDNRVSDRVRAALRLQGWHPYGLPRGPT